jgi:type VI secretion system secreted protein VgrG
LTGGVGRYFRYQITGRPWLWLLTRTSDCRIFQNVSVPDIVKDVLGKYPEIKFESRLTGDYRPWEYCVQYRETDFNFVSRLLELEGIYYFFQHEVGKHTLTLADSYAAHEAVEGYEAYVFLPQAIDTPRQRDEVIEDWLASKEMQPGAYVVDDYDFERPSVELEAQFKDPRQHARSRLEMYDYPGEFVAKPDGERIARTRLEELLAQHEFCEASGTTRSLQVGSLFTLTAHPRADQNREYLVTSAEYSMRFEGYEGLEDTGGDYRCSFTCIPSKVQYRPPRRTPKPMVQGPQTAVVVGPAGDEIHTDKYGRVKVHFHWDRHGKKDENDTTWIRVSHPWAGKGWGAVAIPRIGQEVIVDFLEGDPDQPIITGRVYNAETMPPFGLPGAGVISGIKSNTHKGRGYNEMTMDDTAGKEKVNVHAQYDMVTTVLHDDTQTVKNNRAISVDGTHTETIKKDTSITVSEGNLSQKVSKGTADYFVLKAVTETFNATQETKVKQNITIKSLEGEVLVTAANKITLLTGSSKIEMRKDGSISITGKNIFIHGDVDAKVDAPKIAVAGGDEAKIGCGNQSSTYDKQKTAHSGAAINASAVGMHEITGAVVKIN